MQQVRLYVCACQEFLTVHVCIPFYWLFSLLLFVLLFQTLLSIADSFIENVVSSACQMAKHRKSNTLEVKDVQLCLGWYDTDVL